VIFISGIGAYVAVQFLLALRASIRGLERSASQQQSLLDLLPCDRDEQQHLTTVAKGYIRIRRQIGDVVNGKVTQMAIAQRALANAVGAMVVIAVVLFLISVQQAIHGSHP
jgi:hypothetical protein